MRRAQGIAAAAVAAALGACGATGSGDSAAQSAGWSALHPAKLARTEVAAARVGRDIYVVGGFEEKTGKTTAVVERYDIDRDRWARVKSMPVALNHAVAVEWNEDLYVAGGYTAPECCTHESRALFRYDPRKDRWSRMASAPSRRAAAAAAVVAEHMYLVGGARGGQALATLEVYDFEHDRWRSGPSMPTPREHLAAAGAGGRLYALAGRAAGKGNFKLLERYDPKTRRWKRLPDMAKARGGIAAAALSTKELVVFGGEDAEGEAKQAAGTIREVERYNAKTQRWSALPDMPTPRHGLGGVALGRDVYAVEGGPEPGLHFSNAIETLSVP